MKKPNRKHRRAPGPRRNWYTVRDPDGSTRRVQSKHYSISWTDAQGKRQRETLGESFHEALDEQRKRQAAAKREREQAAALGAKGDARGIDFSALQARYIAALKLKAVPRHALDTAAKLTRFAKESGIVYVRDVTAEKIEGFLRKLSESPMLTEAGKEEGARAPTSRTVNHHLTAIKALFAWAVRSRLLPFNPAKDVAPLKLTVRRRVRRALSPAECTALLQAALRGPIERARERVAKVTEGRGNVTAKAEARYKLEGERNALAYLIFLTTGIRFNELRQLTWGDVDLDAETLTIRGETAKGDATGKARADAVQPLPVPTVAALRAWRVRCGAFDLAAPVLKLPADFSRTLTKDLGLARVKARDGTLAPIAKRDGAGRVVDLHALRHTYGTMLARSGADPKTVQDLMRHSSVGLTFGVYVHADGARNREAAAALPDLSPQGDAPAAAARTGTDDRDEPDDPAGSGNSRQRIGQRLGKEADTGQDKRGEAAPASIDNAGSCDGDLEPVGAPSGESNRAVNLSSVSSTGVQIPPCPPLQLPLSQGVNPASQAELQASKIADSAPPQNPASPLKSANLAGSDAEPGKGRAKDSIRDPELLDLAGQTQIGSHAATLAALERLESETASDAGTTKENAP